MCKPLRGGRGRIHARIHSKMAMYRDEDLWSWADCGTKRSWIIIASIVGVLSGYQCFRQQKGGGQHYSAMLEKDPTLKCVLPMPAAAKSLPFSWMVSAVHAFAMCKGSFLSGQVLLCSPSTAQVATLALPWTPAPSPFRLRRYF